MDEKEKRALTSEEQVLRSRWRLADHRLAHVSLGEDFLFVGRVASRRETIQTSITQFSLQVNAGDRVWPTQCLLEPCVRVESVDVGREPVQLRVPIQLSKAECTVSLQR